MFIQLPRIHQIMPQRVETAGNGSNRCEERTCEPDGKDRVLLPKRLPARDDLAITAPDVAPEGELRHATHQ